MERRLRCQIYLSKNLLGADEYKLVKKLDIGDIIGVRGRPFRTRTGELSVLADEFKLLTKSLRPLPEKWHGLQDVEIRYRQRYLDLIVNPDVRDMVRARSHIIGFLRTFLIERSFLEVETPMMQSIPGGATAKPFETFHHSLDRNLYLRIAPELYLKRLLVGGFDRVFEINRNFRNEGISSQHNPEFTMLEFYQAFASYEDLMDMTEEMLSSLAKDVLGSYTFTYNDKTVDLTPPWERMTVRKALMKHCQYEAKHVDSRETMLEEARKLGLEVKGDEPRVEMVLRECAESVGPVKMMEMMSFLFGELQGLASELTKTEMTLKESRFEGDDLLLTFVPEA